MTYLSAKLVPGLADRDLSGSASLYQILRDDYSLHIVSAVRRVEAATAGAREARLLKIRRGGPLLVLRSVGCTTGQRPLDHFIAYHRGDRSAFEAELTSPMGSAGRFERVPHSADGPLT
jgi:GntR family transcriptional regulator